MGIRPPINNLLGKKFGRLSVVAITDKRNPSRGVIWECLCDCGKLKLVSSNGLVSQQIISCGCARRKKAKESTYNSIYLMYTGSANKRKISFDLSKKQLIKLLHNNCSYCNSPPSSIKKSTSKSINKDWKEECKVIYNGIDRVDNNKGYNTKNCVTCCRLCNQMKMDESEAQFLLKVKQIYEYRIQNEK